MIEESGFFILYLFYGLVFFTIGSAITSRDLRFSDLKVAKCLWLLALFAYCHGLNEWLELFIRMNQQHLQGVFYPYLLVGKFMLLSLSFIFLLWFGLELLLLNNFNRPVWIGLTTAVVVLAIGSVYSVTMISSQSDLYLRHFVAIPAAAMAGFGFVRHAATVEYLSRRGSKNLKNAGFAILLYGFFAGLFPSGFVFFEIPIEVFRAIAAFLVLHCIMRALQLFDVERKVKIEASLKRFAQSEKMVSLGKLSAGVAHEINNPLANVLMSVELLEKDLNSQDQNKQNLQPRIDRIKRNTQRAAKIAGELLFFSHTHEAELEPFNLNVIIQKTFQLIGSRQKLYDFSFVLGQVPQIEGIPWKIEEVLLNLLMNAMDATPPGGSIEVMTRVEKNRLCCSILDHGSGISEEDLRFVFDPFFTTKEPGKGTGLGLSICFGIMELHGGEILVDSKIGAGTTIKLLFPLTESVSQ